MQNRYKSVGLDPDLIRSQFPDLNEYENTVNVFLGDEFFQQLQQMLENEDYGMAKDATKGLYVLAGQLCLFPLYETLLEIYEDLQYETYQDVLEHYRSMYEIYENIRRVFLN